MASAVKTLALGIRIQVREGETLEAALLRFRKAISRDRGWFWRRRPRFGKKRRDYYLKPSELRRQKALSDRIQKRWGRYRYPDVPWSTLRI